MKKAVLILLTFLAFVSKGQVITGDLKEPIFHIYKDNIYIFNLENDKIFHIRKYNMNLDLLKSFDKKLEESCWEGTFALYFQESEIYTCFQFGKPKMGFKYKPRPGFEMLLTYDLTEIKSGNLADVGAIKDTKNMYDLGSARQYDSGFNTINADEFEKDVKQKYNLKQVGPMLSVKNSKNSNQTFQIANYKDEESDRFYNGYYVLSVDGGKAGQFKKYDFLNFENVNKEQNCFMEFYPNLVRDNDNSILIPFTQKTYRKTALSLKGLPKGEGNGYTIDAYFIMA